MLLTIHNLPLRTQYGDIKDLIISKCGLKDSILDNLQNEGNGMRVTVGVSEEEDAAILVRKINGLYFMGQQLYVEDKRQKRELEQPYRTSMAHHQYIKQSQAQPAYDISQAQAIGMWPTNQPMANFMYQPQLSAQAVQSAYMAYGQQQYSETLMSPYPGSLNEYGQQGYDQRGHDEQSYDQQGHDQQGHDQQSHDQQSYGMPQTDNLYVRRMGAPAQGKTKTEFRWGESRLAVPAQRQAKIETRWGENRPAVPPQGQIRTETRRGEGRSAFPPHAQTRAEGRWGESRGAVPPQDRIRTETRWNEGRSDLPLQGQTRAESRWDESRPVVQLQGQIRTETRRGEGRATRDDRRRSAFDQEMQHEPKRPRWDSRDDRHDRSSDRHDRFREERGQPSRSVGLPDERSKNGSSRFERPSDRESRLERHLRRAQPYSRDQPDGRDQPARHQPARQSHTQTAPSYTRAKQPPAKHTTLDTIKLSKVKGMQHLMSDTIRNLNVQDALVGPSVLKSALRKVVIARIDGIVGTNKELTVADITSRYRNKYPESTDHDMYSNVKQKVEDFGGMSGVDMKDYAANFVIGEGRGNTSQEAPATVLVTKLKRPITNNRQYRQRVILLSNIVMYKVTENLNLSEEFVEPSPRKTILRKVIMERVADILKGMEMLPEDICVPYRQKYPESEDVQLLAKITEKVAEKLYFLTNEEVKEYVATFVTEPSEAVLSFKPLQAKIPPKNAPGGGKGLVPVPPGKIPSYPQGDKKVHAQQKKQHKLELQTMERYEMDANSQKAMDDEVDAIGALITKMLNNPVSEHEKSAYENMNKEDIVTQCKKFLSFHISKRITDGGAKLVRIFGFPKPPNRTDLQEYLSRFNCRSLKKSVKAPFFTASFDSYETVDRLCNMPPVTIGNGISISFKHMHIAPKKPKYSQKHWKSRRKRFIRSLIDHSSVNLLEKDWQTQEEAEKKARDELIGTDDVICVEDEQVPIVDITEDETPHENAEDSKLNDEGQGFLHEDFHVIDEVRESDVDDEAPIDEGDNNDQVDDDWDQTGEDWSDIINAGDKNIASNENAIEGDKSAIGNDENEIVSDEGAIGDDKNAIGNNGNATEGDENGIRDEDDENDDDEEIGENVEDIDIADVDWDDVDEDDLEDY